MPRMYREVTLISTPLSALRKKRCLASVGLGKPPMLLRRPGQVESEVKGLDKYVNNPSVLLQDSKHTKA